MQFFFSEKKDNTEAGDGDGTDNAAGQGTSECSSGSAVTGNGGSIGGVANSGQETSSDSAAAKEEAEKKRLAVLREKVALRTKMIDVVTSMTLTQVTNVKDAEMAASKSSMSI